MCYLPFRATRLTLTAGTVWGPPSHHVQAGAGPLPRPHRHGLSSRDQPYTPDDSCKAIVPRRCRSRETSQAATSAVPTRVSAPLSPARCSSASGEDATVNCEKEDQKSLKAPCASVDGQILP